MVNNVTTILGFVFAAVIVPFLAPKRLLASGASKESPVRTAVFNIAGYGLLLGLPLVVFFVLSHENVSKVHGERETAGRLHRGNLAHFRRFAGSLKAQWSDEVSEWPDRAGEPRIGPDKGPIKSQYRDIIGRRIYQAVRSGGAGNLSLDQWIQKEDVRMSDIRKTRFYQYWIDVVAHPTVASGSGEFSRRYERKRKLNDAKDRFAEAVTNRCLSNPGLFLVSGTDATRPVKSRGFIGPVLPGAESKKEVFGSWLPEGDQKTQTEAAPKRAKAARDRLLSLRGEFLAVLTSLKRGSEAKDVDDDATKFTKSTLKEFYEQRFPKPVATNQTEKLLQIWSGLQAWQADSDEKTPQLKSWLSTNEQRVRSVVQDVRKQNWILLQDLFDQPERHYFRSPDTVFAGHVTAADQQARLGWFWYGCITFIVLGFVTNLNSTCLHGFYRDQLAAVWLRDPKIKLKELDTCSNGGQLPLINFALNHMSGRSDPDPEQRSRFVASPLFCGARLTGFQQTDLYMGGTATVADAVAISGAAVSTATSQNALYRLIMTLTNFRLGQWWQNPSQYTEDHYWPSPIRALVSLFWNAQERSHCFLSDGGHIDNTGLAALLERRCRFMIAIDASYDPDFEFIDLRRLLQAARGKYHLEFEPLDASGFQRGSDANYRFLDVLRPDENGISSQHFVVVRVRYPEPEKQDAILIIAKSTLTGDEPIDVAELAREDEDFPHDSTVNQFLPPARFEHYVILGRHIGNEIGGFLDRQGELFGDEVETDAESPTPRSGPVSDFARLAPDWVVSRPRIRLLVEQFDNDPAFETTSIDKMFELLHVWIRSGDKDTSPVESVVRWASHYASAASADQRKQVCTRSVGLVTRYAERVCTEPVAKMELAYLLQRFEDDVPGYEEALAVLMPSDTAKRAAP